MNPTFAPSSLPPAHRHGMRQQFQSALYLNNSAVTFLTRGECELALDTLNDALFLMECVVRSSLSDTNHTSVAHSCLHYLVDHESLVQKATRHLCATSRVPLSQPPPHPPIHVVSYTGAIDWTLLERFEPKHEHHEHDKHVQSHCGWAIRINDLECSDFEGGLNEIVPAIVLSNYAVAHLCHGSTMTVHKPDTVSNALRLLDVGLTILIVHHRIVDVSEGNMFVAMVILNNICWLHQTNGHATDNIDLQLARQQSALLHQMSRSLTQCTDLGVVASASAA